MPTQHVVIALLREINSKSSVEFKKAELRVYEDTSRGFFRTSPDSE